MLEIDGHEVPIDELDGIGCPGEELIDLDGLSGQRGCEGDQDIVIDTSITSDMPAVGYVRIAEHRYEYSSRASSTFTLKSIPTGTASAVSSASSPRRM